MVAVASALALSACAGEPEPSGAGPTGDGHEHDHSGSFALAANEGGFLVLPVSDRVEAGATEVLFKVIGRTGEVQTEFEEHHEELMHVVLFSHDLTRYMHEHPTMDAEGVWRVPVSPLTEGEWRVVADFLPAGGPAALGFDLTVGEGGSSRPAVPVPYGTPGAQESDVRLSVNGPWEAYLEGETAHERAMPLRVTVTQNGEPVPDSSVTRWMGEDAHLVAILAEPEYEDMLIGGLPPQNAYLHIHPNGPMRDGSITFTAPETPHGWWYVFLEMILDGEKRTFQFVMWAP